MVIRLATEDDLDLLVRLRLAYLTEDKGFLSETDSASIRQQLPGYFNRHLGKDFFAILAEDAGDCLSVAFLLLHEKPASPSFVSGMTGEILNVLTCKPYRRQGIATMILGRLIDLAKQKGVSTVKLCATEAGVHVYEKLGFELESDRYARMKIDLQRASV